MRQDKKTSSHTWWLNNAPPNHSPSVCPYVCVCVGARPCVCVCVCTHVWCVCVPLVEFRYLVFACMPGESCCWQLWSLLLCLRDIFQALLITLFVHVCACVCMRTHVCAHGAQGIQCYVYVLFFSIFCLHVCWSCKAPWAHPCWWDTVL